jgi:hypothetical protein
MQQTGSDDVALETCLDHMDADNLRPSRTSWPLSGGAADSLQEAMFGRHVAPVDPAPASWYVRATTRPAAYQRCEELVTLLYGCVHYVSLEKSGFLFVHHVHV